MARQHSSGMGGATVYRGNIELDPDAACQPQRTRTYDDRYEKSMRPAALPRAAEIWTYSPDEGGRLAGGQNIARLGA